MTLPLHLILLVSSFWLTVVHAVTVYGLNGAVQTTGTGTASLASTTTYVPGAAYTGPAAFNPTTLTAPPIPTPAPPTQFNFTVQNSAADVPDLSIPLNGDFYGFSIEMSVISEVSEYFYHRLAIFPFSSSLVVLTAIDGTLSVGINA